MIMEFLQVGRCPIATGDQWRNNFRKNEGMEPKQKQTKQKKPTTQLWMGLVIEARSDAVKSNIA